MSKHTKEPDTDFDFICKWFEKAICECKKQGRNESALLWSDGLAHLKNINAINKELLEACKEAKLFFMSLPHRGEGKFLAETMVEKAIQKAEGRQ